MLLSCSNDSADISAQDLEDKSKELDTRATDRVSRDEISADSTESTSAQTVSYNGEWFTVKYPSNFHASPLAPTRKMDAYTYVETDEATFVSPDGTVEFFIYSPQWSGDPKSYLEPMENERIESDKTEAATSDDAYAITHQWVSFVDKEGKYTRSFHSRKSEVTHLVFGVKYTTIKDYERYKAAYMAFKKSVVQFAD